MKNNSKTILFILLTTIIYSLAKIFYFKDNPDFITFIANCMVLLAFTLVISIVCSIFRLKKWGIIKVLNRSHMIALITIGISIIGNLGNSNLKAKEEEEEEVISNKYKKIVSEENEKPVKKIGDVKQEFLNEDNLYENYVYNYAIKFPKNYKLNYGIGEYSNILAYNEKSGRQISVNTGDNNVDYSFSNQEANKMLESLTEEHINFFKEEIINKWKTEGSYQDVKLKNSKVVNFYNKKFLNLTFEATRNLNNKDYDYIITDYITFFKQNNYHFFFESPMPQNETEWKEWETLVLETIMRVRISDTITQ